MKLNIFLDFVYAVETVWKRSRTPSARGLGENEFAFSHIPVRSLKTESAKNSKCALYYWKFEYFFVWYFIKPVPSAKFVYSAHRTVDSASATRFLWLWALPDHFLY